MILLLLSVNNYEYYFPFELIHIIKNGYIVPSLNSIVNIDGIKYKVYNIAYSIKKYERGDTIIASLYLKKGSDLIMIEYGTFFRLADGDTFIYIDDIHNKNDIHNIIDYMKRTKTLDYECFYNEDGTKIYFKCISFARESINRTYSFYLSNSDYLLIIHATHSIIFEVIDSEKFNKYFIRSVI